MSGVPFETGLTVHIRKADTGEVRRYHDFYEGHPGWDDDYIWSEGNYSCDCNRALFFGYAIGLSYDEIEHECGDDGYIIDKIETPDGKVVYSETDDDAVMKCYSCGAVHDGEGPYLGDKNPKYSNDPVFVAIHKAFMDGWATSGDADDAHLHCRKCQSLRAT